MSNSGDNVNSWPTKKEVAARIKRSLSAVVRAQDEGLLNPQKDLQGVNRYDPAEVEELERMYASGQASDKSGRPEMAEFKLGVVKDLIDLVRDPRQRIDDLQFKMIDRLQAENDRLSAKLRDQEIEIERARDRAAERTVNLNRDMSEIRIKELAVTRVVDGISRLLTGGKEGGVTLTPEQLEQLVLVEDFFTPEQKQKAQASIMAGKQKGLMTAVAGAVLAKNDKTEEPKQGEQSSGQT